MRFYSVHDDPPVHDAKGRRRQRREGKYRKRVDIRLDSAETSPRARFRFECKRLGRGYPAGRYLGAKGLGCFLRGDCACQDPRAGMLGYVQSDDESAWAGKIAAKLAAAPGQYLVHPNSPWRQELIIRELAHTYRSGHGRGRGQSPITIYHTLLRFH